jgi:hypothetical protein
MGRLKSGIVEVSAAWRVWVVARVKDGKMAVDTIRWVGSVGGLVCG